MCLIFYNANRLSLTECIPLFNLNNLTVFDEYSTNVKMTLYKFLNRN